MKKVYIAGPLFTKGDRWFLEKVTAECENQNVLTYLPHRDAGLCESDGSDTTFYFNRDYEEVLKCDFMVAILHGQDIDSGTAFEIGSAYALGKKIIDIADDIRIAGEITNINLMISNSCDVCFTYKDFKDKISSYIDINE